MRRALILVACLLMSCPKAPPPVVEVPKVVDPLEAVYDTLSDVYRAVEKGDSDALEALFRADALVFGLGPADTWSTSKTIGDRSRQLMLPIGLVGAEVKIDASKPLIGLSSRNLTAWVLDLPRATTTLKGKAEIWLPRLTAHLVRDEDRWRVDALHVSLAVPDEVVAGPDASKKLTSPSDVPNDRSPDADELVGLIRRCLDDYAVKIERTTPRREFAQLGTSSAEVFVGGKTFKDLLKPQLEAIKKAGYSWKLDGNLRVKLAPGGTSAWAAGVVVQKAGVGKKAQTFPPFRFLWTFELEDGFWNISSEHQSLALKEELRVASTDADLKLWNTVREQITVTTPVPAAASTSTAPAPELRPGTATDAGIGVW